MPIPGAFSTVVQQDYRPQIRAGIPGQISHETGWEADTWLVDTAAGIPFGVAVSMDAGKPKGAVIGGTNFLGISVIDVTQTGVPLDPLSGVEVATDFYPQYSNMAVLSRGRCFVVAQADVQAGQSVYYETAGGKLSNSASGTAANGAAAFTQNPNDGDTISIFGTTLTFKNAPVGALQVQIGQTLGATLFTLASQLNTNTGADANIAKGAFEAYPPSPLGAGQGIGANTLRYGATTVGTVGNSLTVTASTPGTTITAMAGGTAAATQITGARWLDNAVAGDPARITLSQQA